MPHIPIITSNYKSQVASFIQNDELVTFGELTRQRKDEASPLKEIKTNTEDNNCLNVQIINEMTGQVLLKFEKHENEEVYY